MDCAQETALLRKAVGGVEGVEELERPPGYEVTLADQSLRLKEIAALCQEADCRNVLVVAGGLRQIPAVFLGESRQPN